MAAVREHKLLLCCQHLIACYLHGGLTDSVYGVLLALLTFLTIAVLRHEGSREGCVRSCCRLCYHPDVCVYICCSLHKRVLLALASLLDPLWPCLQCAVRETLQCRCSDSQSPGVTSRQVWSASAAASMAKSRTMPPQAHCCFCGLWGRMAASVMLVHTID